MCGKPGRTRTASGEVSIALTDLTLRWQRRVDGLGYVLTFFSQPSSGSRSAAPRRNLRLGIKPTGARGFFGFRRPLPVPGCAAIPGDSPYPSQASEFPAGTLVPGARKYWG